MSADAKPRRPHGKSHSGHVGKTQGETRRPPHHTAKTGQDGRLNDGLQKPWAQRAKVATQPAAHKTSKIQPEKSHTEKVSVSAALLKQHKQQESRVQGENACRVCFTQRPDAVVKMYLEPSMAPQFADVMKYLATQKKAYHLTDSAELEKITGSQHHGGVVLVVKRKPEQSISDYLLARQQQKTDCLLALDGVGNPHNLGAIVRSCAHFGVKGVLMTQPDLLQSGAAARTAEGGVEFVDGVRCDNLPLALQLCRQAGYSLITTSSHAGLSLYQSQLPRKVVIVFGEEMEGVSTQVANSTDLALKIPGSGQVESLNVSVAASLIVGEWFRQHQR